MSASLDVAGEISYIKIEKAINKLNTLMPGVLWNRYRLKNGKEVYCFFSTDEKIRELVHHEYLKSYQTPIDRLMIGEAKGRMIEADRFDLEIFMQERLEQLAEKQSSLKEEVLLRLNNIPLIKEQDITWKITCTSPDELFYAFCSPNAELRSSMDQYFFEQYQIPLVRITINDIPGRGMPYNQFNKTMMKLFKPEQSIDSSVQQPHLIRFLIKNNLIEDIEKAQRLMKPCSFFLPTKHQQSLPNTSTFLDHPASRIIAKISPETVGIILNPFHPELEMIYWAKRDIVGIQEQVWREMRHGKDFLKMRPDKFMYNVGFYGTKIHIKTPSISPLAMLEAFFNKLISIEERRFENQDKYYTKRKKLKINLYKDLPYILEHNEGGIFYTPASIQGIFITDPSNQTAISKALEMKDILSSKYNHDNVYFATLKDGIMLKLEEEELKDQLAPKFSLK